ncbi:MAG: bifunctional hydroxymethylpyrimidine kinase/phosphomethylpyrimidine kinase [Dehalococcoidia bacterium]|nr:bifunctional hydroxymethylpyrimidine kinase/phosphomethylpyrimidine kinase [Dehalococcoidia bacterium]
MTPPRAMTIAGSDSGGGAGIQADLKTFAAFGVFGTSAVTAITAQNTKGVTAVQAVDLPVIGEQIDAIVSDIGTDAVKIGMLASSEIVELVAEKLREHRLSNVVVDPVMVATSGDRLLKDGAVESIRTALIPLASVVTPNLDEAMVLTDLQIENMEDMKESARRIHAMGPTTVLVKGGHSSADEGDGRMRDVLFDGESFTIFVDARIDTTSTHGTGCTLSSAIAAGLSHGASIPDAIADAKAYLTEALSLAFPVGNGHGPVNHMFGWWNGAGGAGKGGATHSVAREHE